MANAPEYRQIHSMRQRVLGWRIVASLLTLVVAGVSSAGRTYLSELLLLIAAALFQITVLTCRAKNHELGMLEYADRFASIWNDAFGTVTASRSTARATASSNEAPYFSSNEPPGERRLVQITAECAYWSVRLAKIWRSTLTLLLFITTTLLAVFGITLVPFGLSYAQQFDVARLILLCLTFLVAGDLSELVLECHHLVEELEILLPRLAHSASSATISTDDILLHATQYMNAVSSSAPIPSFLYRRYKVELSKGWESTSTIYGR